MAHVHGTRCCASGSKFCALQKQGRHGNRKVSVRRSLRLVRTRATAADEMYGFELERSTNFEEIWSPKDQDDGSGKEKVVGVVGFGSLLSERSALSTFSTVHNFRMGRVKNYRRIFAHAGPFFLECGIADVATRELASLSVEEGSSQDSIVVSLFDIHVDDIPAFIAREEEYRFMAVEPEEMDGSPCKRSHVICCASTDEAFIKINGQERYDKRYGPHGISKIWDNTLLPCPIYLRHCILAAKNLGPEAYDSFLDYTFLADRQTSIRSHLEGRPDILTSLPPPHLRERYGG